MNFFVNEKQRKASDSTCYLEFQKGLYKDECWLNDSINISADLWDKYNLSGLFRKAVKEFDYYGITVVNKEQWNEIVKISQTVGGTWKAVIDDAVSWADECFENNEVFTICGM